MGALLLALAKSIYYCLVLFVCQYSISQTLPFEKASDFTILKQVVHVQCFVQFGKIVRLCW